MLFLKYEIFLVHVQLPVSNGQTGNENNKIKFLSFSIDYLIAHLQVTSMQNKNENANHSCLFSLNSCGKAFKKTLYYSNSHLSRSVLCKYLSPLIEFLKDCRNNVLGMEIDVS